jgi:FkbM family methyltransferase
MNSWHIKARSLARKVGLIRLYNRFRPVGDYEARANTALIRAIRAGDVVWDVGANVGVYSELFCRWVGENGFVVAFEPFAGSCEEIRRRIPGCPWLSIENIALGDTDSVGRLVTGAESVVNHIAAANETIEGDHETVPVAIYRGDTVLSRIGRIPNVIKVDVEGFEEEVLAGMEGMLSSPELRSLLIEVHFLQLEKRGRQTAPVRIEKLLISKGFKPRWVDSSHLFAIRSAISA